MKKILIIVGFLCVGPQVFAAWPSPLDHLRIWDIRPSTFDFVFTGVTPSSDPSPLLAFNERGGRTHFVHEREMVGAYQVWSYTSRTKEVFKPSINRTRTVSNDQVVLRDPREYRRVSLVENEVLAEDGFTARLTRLDSGQTWVVKQGEVLFYDDWRAEVLRIDETVVVLRLDSDAHQIVPHLMDREQIHVRGVWSEIARLRREEVAREAELKALALEERGKRIAEAEKRIAENRRQQKERLPPNRIEIRTRSLIPPEIMYPPVLICPDCGIKVQPRRGRCRCRGYRPGVRGYPYQGGTVTYGGFIGNGIGAVEAPPITINILPPRRF